ncbi:MAG: hypothetical protein Q9223_005626 [Gallowayella weberi]
MEQPSPDTDRPVTPCASGFSTDGHEPSQKARRPSRNVRESFMSAYVYNRGRLSGSQEAEAALRQQREELERKVVADLERELEEQKRAVDKIKIDHRVEVTTRKLADKWHVEEARMTARKYQAALEQEREHNARKLRMLMSLHQQDRGQMKDDHDYKVNHLYEKISKLVAEKTQGQDTVRQEYAAELKQKQAYIEELEKKIERHATRLGYHGLSAAKENGRPAAEGKAPLTTDGQDALKHRPAAKDGIQHFPNQTALLQQLQMKNSEQAALIYGLQASVSNLGRQLTEMRAAAHHAQASLATPMPYVPLSQHPHQRPSMGNTVSPTFAYPQHGTPQPSQPTLQRPPQSMHPQANGTIAPQTTLPIPYPAQPMKALHHDNNTHLVPQPSHGVQQQTWTVAGANGQPIGMSPERPAAVPMSAATLDGLERVLRESGGRRSGEVELK